ncbi:DUF998 domain-containing protein [Amycolatopsis sp. CA-230715]|uniref:DUF998 domain-containing protein n=1 Tax=Amycolatopsis sp. CA-230715 TaxID=2745196 RepID=UPI001C019730|nr:DUF998 domain-containing protein [Amycolatopsis sp. CA-230715]QWF76666.1 hypothetical protein HUW46_00042 [Amycolatopsis sp. CA-230715]
MTQATARPQDTLVHSYLFLRRAIGVIGVALPFVLVLGKFVVDGGGLLNSISSYYHTDLRDVFVGAMVATGVFLLSYRGYDRLDEITGDIAAVAAIGLAVCPTTPADPTATDRTLGTLHLVFAGVFFLSLAFFCLVLFTRTDKTEPTERKAQRNFVYVVTGWTIVVCLVLIAVCSAFFSAELASLHPALWLEAIAILAFGFAWLTKGDAILRDLPRE